MERLIVKIFKISLYNYHFHHEHNSEMNQGKINA